MGVIHMIGEENVPPPPDVVSRLRALATQAGARIGTVRAFERSHLQASTDPLTGLVNRRTLETKARELLRQGRQYTVLLGDLDHFKRLNDTHGHDAGDRALRLFGMVVKEAVRESDVAARYGGEEFAIVLPTQGVAAALAVAQRIRTRLAEALSSGDTPAFTVSMGISASRPGVMFDDVLREADQALYRAKESGRDRVVVAEEAGPIDDASPVRTSYETFDSTEGIFAHMNEPDPVMDRNNL
jgi:diguanylate cyclase (GGDEF)-like protein